MLYGKSLDDKKTPYLFLYTHTHTHTHARQTQNSLRHCFMIFRPSKVFMHIPLTFLYSVPGSVQMRLFVRVPVSSLTAAAPSRRLAPATVHVTVQVTVRLRWVFILQKCEFLKPGLQTGAQLFFLHQPALSTEGTSMNLKGSRARTCWISL